MHRGLGSGPGGRQAGRVSASDTPARPAVPAVPWWRNEDWLAVVMGGLFIAAVLAGWRPLLPGLKWKVLGDLSSLWSWDGGLGALALVGGGMLAVAAAAVALLGGRVGAMAGGFVVVFALAVLSQICAGHTRMNALGLEYVIFGLALGLGVGHLIRLPGWIREAVRTELYIKTGLVILGSTILFQELLQAGALGLLQAGLVVTVVWYAAYWLARRLRVDDEFAVMLSTAVSICGVSAAIAACGAIQGDRRKLSYVTSLVLIVAVPMMVVMPWVVKAWGIPELVAGAWLGGTLDTSGSVVAAGQLIGEKAMKAGVIVKFSQNVLIGVAAFALSIWWAMREKRAGGQGARASVRVIWERFPKFVLGFMGASLLFSFVLEPALVKQVKPVLNHLRNLWFAMAFVSIGLETRFGDLVRMDGGRPALAFIGAQAFNVVWTLVLAWLLFGGILVAVPDIR